MKLAAIPLAIAALIGFAAGFLAASALRHDPQMLPIPPDFDTDWTGWAC